MDNLKKQYKLEKTYLQVFNVNCPTESLPWNCLNLIFTEITKNNNKKNQVIKYNLKIILINVFEK